MNLIPWRNKKRQQDDSKTVTAEPMTRLRMEMDDLFNRFFQDPWFRSESGPWSGSRDAWLPMMDVTEGDDEVILRAELPGIDPKDVEVTVSGNLLTLSGEKKRVNEHRRDHCFHRECCYGSFRRSIELPQGIDPEKVVAEHANGVLTVRLKRTESDKAKHIPVKVQEE